MRLPKLYPILDTAALAARGLGVVEAARVLLDGGVRLLQLRHKEQYTRQMFETAQAVAALSKGAGAVLVIDDRVDIAGMLGVGVHLGQQDLPVEEARRLLGPAAVVGFSTHNPEQLRAAAGLPADYVALGPLFPTASKEKPDPVVGLDGLRRLRPLSPLPLVAIGGITRGTARLALDAGADSLAVIGDLYPLPGAPEALSERLALWLEAVGE